MVASLFISNQIKQFILLATWFLLILVYTSKTEMAKYLLIYNGKSCGWRWLVRKPYTVKQTTQKQNTVLILFSMGAIKEQINTSIEVSENRMEYFLKKLITLFFSS